MNRCKSRYPIEFPPPVGVAALLCRAASVALWAACATTASADEPATKSTFSLGGAYQLKAPATWVAKPPRTRIVEHEFAVPAAKGDELEGRVTVMGAGGSVEANIDRWVQQFTQPDGGSTKDRAKIKKLTAAGQDVTLVDLSGTYLDRPGPQAPGVERENYRMLAAIVQTKQAGNYFIKFYGPQRTVTENEAGFQQMIESLQAK